MNSLAFNRCPISNSFPPILSPTVPSPSSCCPSWCPSPWCGTLRLRDGGHPERLVQQFGAQCFVSLIIEHIKKKLKHHITDKNKSTKPKKQKHKNHDSKKLTEWKRPGSPASPIRGRRGRGCVCGVREGLVRGAGERGGTLKGRPTGWLSALDCDGNVTGLKAQVEGQLFGLWGCCIGHTREKTGWKPPLSSPTPKTSYLLRDIHTQWLCFTGSALINQMSKK